MADLNLTVNESIAVLEQVEVTSPGDIFVSESISVSDTVIANKMGDIKVSESIQVTDSVTPFLTGEGTILRFTLDGALLVNLNEPPYFLLEFSSEAPMLRSQRLASSLEDGENVLYSRYNNVVQPIKVLVGGDSNEDVQQAVEALEEVCSKVATSFGVESVPVMLEYKPKGATLSWESRAITATLVSEFDRAQEPSQKLASPVPSYDRYSIVTIQIERAFYWQGPLTDLAISNGHGAGVGGVDIYNCNDTWYDNFVDIAENAVGGGLPTPAEIRLESDNPLQNLTNYMLSLNTRFVPSDFVHGVEGEWASWYAGASSIAYSSKYSYGEALHVKPYGDPGDERLCAKWNLSEQKLLMTRSRWFHILMYTIETTGLAEEDLVQLRVSYGDVEVAKTPWRMYGMAPGLILDCGALRLPPFVLVGVASHALVLELWVRSDEAVDFYLDFFHLFPASRPDGFVNIVPYDFSVPDGSAMVHDGPRYAAYEGIDKRAGAWFTPEGRFLYLQPNVAQRLLVLVNNDYGDVPIDIKHNLKIKYYPRRLRV